MKRILNSFQALTALALLALAVGCATDLHSKENLAIAAGFKIITPSNPNQQAILANLPPGKVSPVNHQGKTYYVLPDVKNNQAYVGGPKQLQSYKALRVQQQVANDNLMAAEMNEDASMNMGMWGGWGGGMGGAWGTGWY